MGKIIDKFAEVTIGETSLFWPCCHGRTLPIADEKAPTGIKDTEDMVTVWAVLTQRACVSVKLAMIGKSCVLTSLNSEFHTDPIIILLYKT